MQHTKKFR